MERAFYTGSTQPPNVPMAALEVASASALPSTRLHTKDIGEQAERLRHWDQTYIQLSPGAFEGRIVEGWFGDIQVFRESTNQAIHESGCSRPGSQTFCVPVAMDGHAHFRGVEWSSDHCTTMGGDVDFDLCTSGALDVVAVSLQSDRLLTAAEEQGIDAEAMRRSLSRSCSIALSSQNGKELRLMLMELAALIETESVILSKPAARLGIENAIYETALGLFADGSALFSAPATFRPHRSFVYQAIDYVASRPDELVTVNDLCVVLRVSRRTLQHYFDEVLHVSPLQYLRAYRLNKVRSTLLHNSGTLAVNEAAAQWGFWHLSQFAADYRRLFGELPSQTANTGRRLAEMNVERLHQEPARTTAT